MVQRGNDVTVYNRGGHNVFGKEFDGKKLKKYKGINIVTVPTVKGAACVPIYSFLATIHAAFSRYDCVSFRASGSCAMIPLAKLFGLRVVASLHGIDSQRDKWGGFASKYLEFGERMAATKADVCLVLSKNMKEYIDTKYGVNSILFANGIDKPKSHAPEIIKEKYGLEKNEYILSLGRIVPEKGIQYLIKAFRECSSDRKLVIAGGSESNKDYYNQLLALAEGDERIIFTGYVYGQEVQELYSNDYKVHLVAEGVKNLPTIIAEDKRFSYTEIKAVKNSNIFLRLKKRGIKTKGYRAALKDTMDGDIVWTVNPSVVRTLGKELLEYSDRHVMQLMELTDTYPMFRGAKILKFNIKHYAQKAWKIVVPEENRAYIQKVGWNLEKLPYVLPNKPYYLKSGEVQEDMPSMTEPSLSVWCRKRSPASRRQRSGSSGHALPQQSREFPSWKSCSAKSMRTTF